MVDKNSESLKFYSFLIHKKFISEFLYCNYSGSPFNYKFDIFLSLIASQRFMGALSAPSSFSEHFRGDFWDVNFMRTKLTDYNIIYEVVFLLFYIYYYLLYIFILSVLVLTSITSLPFYIKVRIYDSKRYVKDG